MRPVAIPSPSRSYIAPGSNPSSSGPAPSIRRRNHGCQPIHAGIGSSAASSSSTLRRSGSTANRWVTVPANGHGCPNRTLIVSAETTSQGRSKIDAVDRVRRHVERQLVVATAEGEPAAPDAAGERRHRVAAPPDRAGIDAGDKPRPASRNEAMRPPSAGLTSRRASHQIRGPAAWWRRASGSARRDALVRGSAASAASSGNGRAIGSVAQTAPARVVEPVEARGP